MAVLTLTWTTPPPAPAWDLVVATGIFDVLHVGHVRFLAGARARGDALVVGIESDERAAARKGPGRPLVPAAERAELIAALRSVNAAFVIDGSPDAWNPDVYAALLAPLRPAALALTDGDRVEAGKREAAARIGARVEVLPLVEDHSTSLLTQRIAASVS